MSENYRLTRQFKYCPICATELIPNPAYRHSVKYCPEDGDFYLKPFPRHESEMVIFKRYGGKIKKTSILRGNPGVRIKCDQTGVIFDTIKDIGQAMGLDRTSISRHLNGNRYHTHVGGYTFSLVHPEK